MCVGGRLCYAQHESSSGRGKGVSVCAAVCWSHPEFLLHAEKHTHLWSQYWLNFPCHTEDSLPMSVVPSEQKPPSSNYHINLKSVQSRKSPEKEKQKKKLFLHQTPSCFMDQMHFYNFSFTYLLNHHICLCMKLYSFISAHSSIKMAIHNQYAVSAVLQNMTKCYIYSFLNFAQVVSKSSNIMELPQKPYSFI